MLDPKTKKQSSFRLLIVGISWPPETFLARLINGLTVSGVEVTIAGYVPPTGVPAITLPLNWLRLSSWTGMPLLRIVRLLIMGIRACLFCRENVSLFAKYSPDTKDVTDWLRYWTRMLPYAGTGKRWDAIYFPWNSGAIIHRPLFELGCPIIVSCRGSQVNVAPNSPTQENHIAGLCDTFSRAAVVHCVSEDIQRKAQQYGLSRERSCIIRPAVDPTVFCPALEPNNTRNGLHIVSTGSILWVKGYEYALLAVQALIARGFQIQYDIIGDGEDRQRVLYTIHDLGLENHVRLLGRLAPTEVVRCLQQADVFLLSSLSEGISNAVLEAMSCGLPVVTTDCGGMREAVSDGVEGFVVPVRDTEAMAEALAKLASSPELRKTMGVAARKRILQEFTLERQICQWHELLQSLYVSS